VAQFAANVLKALASDAGSGARVEPLPPDLVRFLSYCWLAGSGARMEWIRETCGLENQAFMQSIQNLSNMGYISLVEECGITRIRIADFVPSPPLSSLFTQKGLQTANLALSVAMQVFPDDSPAFEAKLSDAFTKAGRYLEAVDHLQKAAGMLESLGHWYPAAEHWQKASTICAVVGDGTARVRSLCEAARCAAKTDDLELVDSLGRRAVALAQSPNQPASLKTFVHISVGNAFQDLDLRQALTWYRQGLSCAAERLKPYASLLVNITSVLIQMKMVGAAEQSLAGLEGWIAQNKDSAGIEHFRGRSVALEGLICLQKHDWLGAKSAFDQVIAQGQGKQSGDIGVAWHSLGLLGYFEDRCQESRDCFASAEQCFSESNLERQLEALYVDMAKLALREGSLEEAEELLSRSDKSPHERLWILMLRACIEKCRGHTAKAISMAKAAIDGFRSKDFENELACAALWLSKALTQKGDLADARFYENWAFTVFGKKGWDVKHLHRQCALLNPRPDAIRK
jgi:tetratricopeptide (TPR) repeat protein